MKTTDLNGHEVQFKTGTIESVGNKVVALDSSTISGLTFTDGETVRHTIMVESSIAQYVAPGMSGTFVFADGPAGRSFVVAVDMEGRGLRVANPAPFRKVLAGGIVPTVGVFGILAFAVLGGVMMPFLLPAALIPAGFALRGVFTIMGLSKLISIISTIDRSRQIPGVAYAQDGLAAA